MREKAPWQVSATIIFLLLTGYLLLSVVCIMFGILGWRYPTLCVLALLLPILTIAIPAMLNYSRGSYKILFPWYFIHNLISVVVCAFIYLDYGVFETTTGKLDNSFISSIILSFNVWTTLGFGDLIPVSKTRLFSSIQAFLGMLTIPVGVSLIWLWVTDSMVPPHLAFLERKKYKFDEMGDIIGKKEDG